MGNGQNIYHFSYYGLYNPFIVLSYCFPFIDMGTYIMIVMILCLIASTLLFYTWLISRQISKPISFLVSLMFVCSAPMIYHSYHQISFVNYMPFLILAFIGIDRFFNQHSIFLFVLSVWLMILTSFYFSVSGILVLILYGFFRYLQMHPVFHFKQFLKDGFRFLMPICIAIGLSGILLIPTFFVLFSGRNQHAWLSLKELLIPNLNFIRFLYDPYGLGTTSFTFGILFSILCFEKKEERILVWICIILFCIPLFSYILNGGLYIRNKVWIPFLPLLYFLVASYCSEEKKTHSFLWIPWILVLLLNAFYSHSILYGIEALLFLLCHKKKTIGLCVSILCLCICNSFIQDPLSYTEYKNMISKSNISSYPYRMETNTYEKETINRIDHLNQYRSSIYSSSYNSDFYAFQRYTFQTEQPYRNRFMQPCSKNPIYQMLMSTKYIGQTKNENVFPMAYTTKQVISKKVYDSLSFPYNQLSFLQGSVIQNTDSSFMPSFDLQKMNLPESKSIQSKVDQEEILDGFQAKKGDLIMIQFLVKNHKDEDVSIWIEDIKNKLSASSHIYYNENDIFTFVFSSKEDTSNIKIKYGKGDYSLQDIQGWICPASYLQTDVVDQKLQWNTIQGNKMDGHINIHQNQYLITSIPYDDSFEVYVDGQKIAYEKVNTAFLGFPLKKGEHDIHIEYHAPGFQLGLMSTIVSMIVWFTMEYLRIHQKIVLLEMSKNEES
ncbi:YfhO family protein [Floccifex sp.]|uniref:YfhO family protein n=1 Tax=Floccifex sp. TaxID=2815810 RepID=UPI003EFFCCED